jgi:hypothetical protein
VGLLAGSPLLPPYLRLLGAKVGRDCHVASAGVGLPMLVDIGDGGSIGYGAQLQPFVVEGGWLWLAPIRLGSSCSLGTNSVVLAGGRDRQSGFGGRAVPGACQPRHPGQRALGWLADQAPGDGSILA